MAKFFYWTSVFAADDDETSMSTVAPLKAEVAAGRRIDDTMIRVLFWAQVAARVSGTAPPPDDWLSAATADMLVYFDNDSSNPTVAILDDNPDTVGFVRLNLTVWQKPTAGQYTALWQGPVEGVNLEGRRKGIDPTHAPSVSFQRWVADNHGVWDNFAHYGVLFSSRLIGRVLWASDSPV